jgi:hypothetical protein
MSAGKRVTGTSCSFVKTARPSSTGNSGSAIPFGAFTLSSEAFRLARRGPATGRGRPRSSTIRQSLLRFVSVVSSQLCLGSSATSRIPGRQGGWWPTAKNAGTHELWSRLLGGNQSSFPGVFVSRRGRSICT